MSLIFFLLLTCMLKNVTDFLFVVNMYAYPFEFFKLVNLVTT